MPLAHNGVPLMMIFDLGWWLYHVLYFALMSLWIRSPPIVELGS
jgi:hypothetical protein